jgi:CMP-N,N'-diacetyllegionaminic acid synthase
MKILCTICSRGESKGIKNINKINGRKLIFYTMDVTKKLKLFVDIVVSLDSKKILNIAKKYSTNISPKIMPIKNCLE